MNALLRAGRHPVRLLIAALLAGALAVALVIGVVMQTGGSASQGVKRIGFLSPTWANSQGMIYPQFAPAMAAMGYIEGTNVRMVTRFADGRDDRLPQLANELVAEGVDVIVTLQPSAALAAKRATSTIPIVFLSISDPVRIGLVQSMRRPGGNVTGVSNTPADLNPKRLEILKDALPGLARVAILARAGNPNSQAHLRDNVAAAQRLGISPRIYNITGPDQFEPAVLAMVENGMQAILLVQDGVFFFERQRIIDLALKHRLPLIADGRVYARDGALLSYGISDYATLLSAAVVRVDLVLRGVHAGDIPVDQPMDIGLAINLSTARKIGVPIARTLLRRAEDIYE